MHFSGFFLGGPARGHQQSYCSGTACKWGPREEVAASPLVKGWPLAAHGCMLCRSSTRVLPPTVASRCSYLTHPHEAFLNSFFYSEAATRKEVSREQRWAGRTQGTRELQLCRAP